eukprot:CAMPEP_0175122790 /NCGR_PEP_ID=MMETSP0087-20121206/1901_1 /TAXON_ID=136419 /ORGANISM="Unknown Unknown, Strain D1" /LENGTH=1351 /DNA_ID=CAMNT_0016404445 /DNA_START=71 /DNA_END=4127 /DNA_ORIENTATION=-
MIGVLMSTKNWNVMEHMGAAVSLAVDEINVNLSLTGGLRLGYVFGEDTECSTNGALRSISKVTSENQLAAIIGPGCSLGCEVTGLVAASLNLLEISYSCTSPKLSDKQVFPTFLRTVGSISPVATVFLQLFLRYSWTEGAIVGSTQAYVFSSAATATSIEFQKAGLQTQSYFFQPEDDISLIMSAIKKQGFPVIMLFAYDPDIRRIMLSAKDLGIAGKGFAYFSAEALTEDAFRSQRDKQDGRDLEAKAATSGMIGISVTPRDVEELSYRTFLERHKHRTFLEYGIYPKPISYLAAVYDSVYLYAHLVGLAVKANIDYRDGRALMKLLPNVSLSVLGRNVSIDDQGDRVESGYTLYNWVDGRNTHVADFSLQTKEFRFLSKDPIVWPGNTTAVPRGVDVLIGVMLPSTGSVSLYNETAAAVPVVIEDINTNFGFVFGQDPACSNLGGLNSVSFLLQEHDIDAFLGPICSQACEATALLTTSRNILHISPSCRSSKGKFSTFARTVPPLVVTAVAFASLLEAFAWNKAIILYTSDFSAEAEATAQSLTLNTLSLVLFDSKDSKASVMQIVQKHRINVVLLFTSTLAIRDLVLAAHDLNMLHNYVYISVESMSDDPVAGSSRRDKLARNSLQGLLMFGLLRRRPSSGFNIFLEKYRNKTKEMFGATPFLIRQEVESIFDSIHLYAHAVKAARVAGINIQDGKAMRSVLSNTTFAVYGSSIRMDQNGDRQQDISLFNLFYRRDENGTAKSSIVHVADFSFKQNRFTRFKKIVWMGNATGPPKSTNLVCPKGTEYVKTSQGEQCGTCREGTFNLVANSTCKLCPPRAVCRGGANIGVQQDFWYDQTEYNSGVARVYTCAKSSWCCRNETGCFWGSNEPVQPCKALHQGVLCASCVTGSSCVECQGTNWPLLGAAFGVSAMILTAILIKAVFSEKEGIKLKKQSLSSQDIPAPLAPLLIDYFQMAFPLSLSGINQAFTLMVRGEVDSFFMQYAANGCFFPVHPLIQPLTRLLFFSLAMMQWIGLRLLFQLLNKLTIFRANMLKTCFFQLLFAISPLLAEICLGYLKCVEVGGKSFMQSTGVECYTGAHGIAAGLALTVAVVVFIGIPALMRWEMHKMSVALQGATDDPAPVDLMQMMRKRFSSVLGLTQTALRPARQLAMSDLDQPYAVRQMYQGLNAEVASWYESYFIFRRNITAIIVVYGTDSSLPLLLGLWFSCCLLIHKVVQPYEFADDNHLQDTFLVTVIVLGLFKLYVLAAPPSNWHLSLWVIIFITPLAFLVLRVMPSRLFPERCGRRNRRTRTSVVSENSSNRSGEEETEETEENEEDVLLIKLQQLRNMHLEFRQQSRGTTAAQSFQ